MRKKVKGSVNDKTKRNTGPSGHNRNPETMESNIVNKY